MSGFDREKAREVLASAITTEEVLDRLAECVTPDPPTMVTFTSEDTLNATLDGALAEIRAEKAEAKLARIEVLVINYRSSPLTDDSGTWILDDLHTTLRDDS